MRSFIRLKNVLPRRLPDEFRDDEVRYADELVEVFLRHFTRPGDVVLDPFAGFGTTLVVAEAMDRVAYGVELDPRRAAYIRGLVRYPERVITGDSRQIAGLGLPAVDLVMTSPPYGDRAGPEDPLTNYQAPGAGYDAYLGDLRGVFVQLRELLRPGAHVVVEVANLKGPQGVTTLAWDVARVLDGVLRFEGEVVVGWDRYGYGYDHSYCLVYTRGR